MLSPSIHEGRTWNHTWWKTILDEHFEVWKSASTCVSSHNQHNSSRKKGYHTYFINEETSEEGR